MPKLIYVEPTNALAASIDYEYGLAAVGPDYGVGNAPAPVMIDAGYQSAHVVVIPENYGARGPVSDRSNKWIKNMCPGVAANPLGSPTYNSATPQGLFHLKVDNAQQYARWQVNAMATDPGIPSPVPVSYASAAAATLYGGK